MQFVAPGLPPQLEPVLGMVWQQRLPSKARDGRIRVDVDGVRLGGGVVQGQGSGSQCRLINGDRDWLPLGEINTSVQPERPDEKSGAADNGVGRHSCWG
jgi:hypothetical protein